jgi:hypothetical protein
MLFVLFGFIGFMFVVNSESRDILNFHPSLFYFSFFLLAMFVSVAISKIFKLPDYEDVQWNGACSYFFGSVLALLMQTHFDFVKLGVILIGLVIYVVFLLNAVQVAVKNNTDLP